MQQTNGQKPRLALQGAEKCHHVEARWFTCKERCSMGQQLTCHESSTSPEAPPLSEDFDFDFMIKLSAASGLDDL